ncbi:MAG: DNA-binding protein [Oscillospiraceae bacterium]|nr:DNA-binding protein [Oscillospiraceae bacterium]
MIFLGLDTSNYTTSIAALSEYYAKNVSRLLPVPEGQMGLRQSDALFHHVRQLPLLSGELFSSMPEKNIHAIGVSTRPRDVEGSYMPCFLAGESFAQVLSQALNCPIYRFSHQQGHIAASAWSSGHMELLDVPHLAWHLSGGTTELLHVVPDGRIVHADRIGGTTDISAGQLIDRCGKLLGLPFPSGSALDRLSTASDSSACFHIRLKNLDFSFSGVQNKVESFYSGGASAEQTARYVLLSVIHAVIDATEAAMKAYPELPIVFSGGVASNSMLRESTREMKPYFALPEYSTDNAMGIAVLTSRMEE